MMTRGRRVSRGLRAACAFAPPFVCALSVAFVVVVLGAVFVSTAGASSVSASGSGHHQKAAASGSAKDERDARTLYRINLKLDFDARRYEGSERVRWTNQDDRPASFLYFHLYPNTRAEDERAAAADASAPEEPRL